MPPPRFHAPAAAGDGATIALPADEARHLARVLRLEAGARVRVFDGRGREWDARVADVTRDEARVTLDTPAAPVDEPPVRVTVAVGLLKGAQMDAVVRDATALGASALVPLDTTHVAVAGAGRRTDAGLRWHRVAVAAAKQCGRAVVPDIGGVSTLDAAVAQASAAGARLVACLEPAAGLRTPPDPGAPPAEAWLFVGPEGGWSAAEVALLEGAGAVPLALGARTIRAELMPAVALSVLWTRWGW